MTDVDVVNVALSKRERAEIFTEAKAAGPQETIDILVDAGVITEKDWWTSIGINGSLLTIVGALVSIGAGIASYFGYTVDVAATTSLVLGLIGLVSGAMTWIGRLRAVQPISRTQVAPGVSLEKSR